MTVAELDERAAAQHAPTVEGVTLASLHSAKGLEWDVVFLVGVAEGMMPITYAKTAEQIEEERRLLYVGVTRARELLHVSRALPLARRPSEPPPQPLPRRAAPRLGRHRGEPAATGGPGGVEQGLHEQTGATPRRRQRTPARCRVCGRTLTDAGEMKLMRCEDCPVDMDEGLYE
ncbi:DNA 3'-5' helicase OS=Streptomyces alboniger OX=132473 GN=CP975_23600 PE=3 SV=1 [Streptomyces alboniger]